MPRLTQINEILFPVEEHPFFVTVPMESGYRRLPVPNKKALVNTKTDRVLSIVGRGYRLVTNREALDWAFECCNLVFPETNPVEWEVMATDAPESGGYCFIDLKHNSNALDFSTVSPENRPDVFGPFIRVTNSYNCLRALSFDIGFFRKVCKNGMILPDSIIRFKFTHSQKEIGERIKFEINRERISKIKAGFNEYIGALQTCIVPRATFNSLIYEVLLIHQPKNMGKNEIISNDWNSLSDHLTSLCERYSGELGENAYAVLNAITDFASHPPENRCVHRDRHGYQRLAGVWLSQFSKECQQDGFKLPNYLEKLKEKNKKIDVQQRTIDKRQAH